MILGLPPQITRMQVPPSGAVPTSPQPQFVAPPPQASAQTAPLQQAQMPLQGQTPPTSPLLASMVAGSAQPVQQSSPLAGSGQLSQALLAKALSNNQQDQSQPGLLANLFNQYVNPLFSPGPISPAAQTAATSQ